METKMKKKYRKVFRITLLTFLTTILTIAIIILFPQKLFANKMKYKEFTVCSNDKIDDDIKIILDNAMAIVRKSELYDASYKYNIILCYNTFYNKIDNKVFGTGPAARTRLHNVIIKVRIDPKDNLAFATFRKPCEVNLTELIAHEMTHVLQGNKFGLLKFNPFKHPEFWKLEGYPEYISKQAELSGKDYNLASDIDRYISLEGKAKDFWILEDMSGCEAPYYYYKGRLMIEYLMDIKHLSYEQILKDTSSESTIYQEMVKWKDIRRLNISCVIEEKLEKKGHHNLVQLEH
jgi:hypothetical protein